MSSHYDPTHPRYCTPQRFQQIKAIAPGSGRTIHHDHPTMKKRKKIFRREQRTQRSAA